MSLDEFRLQRDAAPLALLGRRRPSPAASFALTKDGRFVLVLPSRPGDPPPPVSGSRNWAGVHPVAEGSRLIYVRGTGPSYALCRGPFRGPVFTLRGLKFTNICRRVLTIRGLVYN